MDNNENIKPKLSWKDEFKQSSKNEKLNPIEEMEKALNRLYIEVEASIAEDIHCKCRDAVNYALRQSKSIELDEKIEELSEQVHISWMKEKLKQGFHCPMNCNMRPVASFEKFEKYCNKCHTDLYPYNELPENIKEYDRVTVRSVLKAIDKLNEQVRLFMDKDDILEILEKYITPSFNAINKDKLEYIADDILKELQSKSIELDAEKLAIKFHNIYERLAPDFGYETRKEIRQFDKSSANGKLMIAVCKEILR